MKILRDDSDLAKEFDFIFDFYLLDKLSKRNDAEGQLTFSLPGKAFAKDASDGKITVIQVSRQTLRH